ncbi:MAG: SDR family oxidoreductase [Anaerolineae bacterium]|nr:SDR family oxidoreductase [Anaerolineae bacterium]
MNAPHAKVILVTGASSGIGHACATDLAALGHRVYGTSRQAFHTATAFTPLRMDVTQEASVNAAIQTIMEHEGRLDCVLNNSGKGFGGAVEDTTLDEAQSLFDVNFFGVVRVCRTVLPIMREQRMGLIINMSSIGGLMGLPYQAPYSASKYAVEGFTESLRLELTGSGIHVVLVEPGDVSTAFTVNRLHAAAAANPDSPYATRYHRALMKIETDERHGHSPEKVARTVVKIVAARKPGIRYLVGPFPQRLAARVKPFLPPSLFERLLLTYYNLG